METTNLRQKHTIKYNQAMKEEMLTADDVQPNIKQMTHLSNTGALATYTPYNKKHKQWMEITDAISWC